jgi:hypothetical protein
MTRRSLVVGLASALAASLLAGGIAGSAASPRQLLGMVGDSGSLRLVRLDPETLRPLPGKRIAVGSGGCASREGGTACWSFPAWSFSPNRASLALARDGYSLRIIDVGRMRVAADLRLGGGSIGALAWLARGRVLAVEEVGYERNRLLAIDVAKGRVTRRTALGGSVLALARTPRELVMLVSPSRAIGAARLAVADARGAVRFVRLGRIVAGSKLLGGPGVRVERRVPGLAVDPTGRRAFVVAPTLAAEIDVRSLAVTYRDLALAPSFRRLLTRSPAALAKTARGYWRWARWLGAGLLAVSGTEEADKTGTRPAGLRLVDTRSWSVRTVDAGATSFLVAGDLLLVTGGPGAGLAAYGFDGRERFRLSFDGLAAWVAQVNGSRVYVGITQANGQREQLLVVDLPSGRVVGERPLPLPWLLLETASSWWGS